MAKLTKGDKKRINDNLKRVLAGRLAELIKVGETRFTLETLIDDYQWLKPPLLEYTQKSCPNPRVPNAMAIKKAKMDAGLVLCRMMVADGHFTLDYYEKKEDERGKARLYILKSAVEAGE